MGSSIERQVSPAVTRLHKAFCSILRPEKLFPQQYFVLNKTVWTRNNKQPSFQASVLRRVSIVCSTFIHPLGQFADGPAHVDEGVEVLVQALVGLPLQPGQGFEVGPVEGLPAGVVDHAVGRHRAVEVCLLPTTPPAAGRRERRTARRHRQH